MPWSPQRWPPARFQPVAADAVMNELRAAMLERDGLVPAGRVPPSFARYGPLRGTPAGGQPEPLRTVANFQHQVHEMLLLDWPLRWWDLARD